MMTKSGCSLLAKALKIGSILFRGGPSRGRKNISFMIEQSIVFESRSIAKKSLSQCISSSFVSSAFSAMKQPTSVINANFRGMGNDAICILLQNTGNATAGYRGRKVSRNTF
jgi:hypothetical protein